VDVAPGGPMPLGDGLSLGLHRQAKGLKPRALSKWADKSLIEGWPRSAFSADLPGVSGVGKKQKKRP